MLRCIAYLFDRPARFEKCPGSGRACRYDHENWIHCSACDDQWPPYDDRSGGLAPEHQRKVK